MIWILIATNLFTIVMLYFAGKSAAYYSQGCKILTMMTYVSINGKALSKEEVRRKIDALYEKAKEELKR